MLARWALSTGIRQQDIEQLKVSDVNTAATLTSLNRKAHKFKNDNPLHLCLTRLLGEYIKPLPKGQESLWPDKYRRAKWERIKRKAGVDQKLNPHISSGR